MTVDDELKAKVIGALQGVDPPKLFWVDVAVAVMHGSSHVDVDWDELDWAAVRVSVDEWLPTLDPDTLDPSSDEATLSWPAPGRDDVRLIVRARARSADARGDSRWSSLTLLDLEGLPDLQFRDGTSASLYALPIATVEALANGTQALAIELPSHHETWGMLLDEMRHFGRENTSEIPTTLIEPYASMLGLVPAPNLLGDFDEGWRAMNRVEFPISDDPRDDAPTG